jgi:hypothetical protein
MKMSKISGLILSTSLVSCGYDENINSASMVVISAERSIVEGGYILSYYRGYLPKRVAELISTNNFTIKSTTDENYQTLIFIKGKELSLSSVNVSFQVDDTTLLEMNIIQPIETPIFDTPYLTFKAPM